MNQNGPTPSQDQMVCSMQIIAGALMAGVVAFGAVAVVISREKVPSEQPILSYIAVALTVMDLMAYAIVPGIIAGTALQKLKGPEGAIPEGPQLVRQLCGVYQTKMVLGMAMLEGGAFFNLFTYINEAQWWSLAATGVLLAAMAVAFPTAGKVQFWIEDQKRLLEMER